MIESIKGRIAAINPAAVTLETASGISFLLNITLPTFTRLEHESEARLLVHESIREDAWTLYGFIDEEERELYRQLTGVSGVGAASARMILSAIPASELGGVIASGDSKRLKSVKGIGAKTAERIIVDLRDKIKTGVATLSTQPQSANTALDEALEALVILGFARAASLKVLEKIYAETPGESLEGAIKRAMKLL